MKDSGILITRKFLSSEDLPFNKLGCCFCNKWKQLICVGYDKQESYMCESCFSKAGKIKKKE